MVCLTADKKQNRCDDLFSQLPDDILVIILSFLTLKEAGRTSVLSSRWTNLWIHTPSLDFEDQSALLRIQNDDSGRSKGIRNYVEWVEWVLKLSKAPYLKQFRVQFYFDDFDGKSIDKWFRYAFSHHVEKLEFNIVHSREIHTFTNKLFCNNIVKTVQSPIDFKPLKELSIKGMNVSGKDIEIFLHNCPFLERIVVWYSSKLHILEISGPTLRLKFLELHHCYLLWFLHVCNTNLVSLSILKTSSCPILLENVPSLVDVSLVFDQHGISIGKVPSLLYSCLLQLETLKVLIGDPENITTGLEFPELTKLKKLVLVVYRSSKFKYLVKLLPLLRATPCLQEFVLEYNLVGARFRRPAKSTRSRNGKMMKMVDRYSLRYLKVVKISGFPCQNSDFDFIRYFVVNAVALQKIIIDPLIPKHPVPELEAAELRQRMRNLAKEFEQELPQHIEWIFLDYSEVKC